MSKENFKNFVKIHPELATHVINKKNTWQDFYELYELYGESNNVWDHYFKTNLTSVPAKDKASSMSELINMVKKVDLDSVQKTVGNLQKTIGLLQDIGIGGSTATKTSSYEPRPMYKYFDD